MLAPQQMIMRASANLPTFPTFIFSPTPQKKSGYAHVGAWRSRIIYDCLSKRALRCIGYGKRGGLSVGDE